VGDLLIARLISSLIENISEPRDMKLWNSVLYNMPTCAYSALGVCCFQVRVNCA